ATALTNGAAYSPTSSSYYSFPSGMAIISTAPALSPGTVTSLTGNTSGDLFVAQPDVRATSQTINSATSNATVAVSLNNGEGIVGFTISGLTASTATLTAEGSNDGGTTWSSINTIAPATGALSTTL